MWLCASQKALAIGSKHCSGVSIQTQLVMPSILSKMKGKYQWMYRIIASCYNHDIWTTICYCDFFLHYMTQQVLQFDSAIYCDSCLPCIMFLFSTPTSGPISTMTQEKNEVLCHLVDLRQCYQRRHIYQNKNNIIIRNRLISQYLAPLYRDSIVL